MSIVAIVVVAFAAMATVRKMPFVMYRKENRKQQEDEHAKAHGSWST